MQPLVKKKTLVTTMCGLCGLKTNRPQSKSTNILIHNDSIDLTKMRWLSFGGRRIFVSSPPAQGKSALSSSVISAFCSKQAWTHFTTGAFCSKQAWTFDWTFTTSRKRPFTVYLEQFWWMIVL